MSTTQKKYPDQIRELALRLVLDTPGQYKSRRVALVSVAGKIGCASSTLEKWVEREEGVRSALAGAPIEVADRIRALEQQNSTLRAANALLQELVDSI